MSATNDLEIIAQQEKLLQFPAFNTTTAWQIGNLLRDHLLALNAGATIEIEVSRQLLFAATTPGAEPGQAEWIRRKRNTVHRFHHASYRYDRTLERDSQTIDVMLARHGISAGDYSTHGGGFPIFLAGTGCIGSILVSGLHQREDHSLIVNTLSKFLNIPVPTLP